MEIKKFKDYKKTAKPDDKEESLKLEDGIEIVGIQDVSFEDPRENNPELKEAMVINADLGGKVVKRGDTLWVTAMVKQDVYNTSSLAVLKVKVVDMFKSLTILNSIK